MKVKAIDKKIPVSITCKKKMSSITTSIDGTGIMVMEFAPTHTIPWLIGGFRFDLELDFRVYGTNGKRIADSDLKIDWMNIANLKY